MWIDALAFNYTWIPVITAALFIGMMACAEIGYDRGKKRAAKGAEWYRAGTGVITAALLTVLAVLLGFSFGSAETRFDRRRQMIIEEANAVGTAYLRVDMLPAREQPVLRDFFRRYLDARLEAYDSAPDIEKALGKIDLASDLSGEIWKRAVTTAARGDNRMAIDLLLLPAINAMIDIATARTSALLQHLPPLSIMLLAGISLVCSFMVGFRISIAKSRDLLSTVVLAAVVSATFYVILDLEFPRLGLIRLDPEDKVLYDLRDNLKEK